VLELFSQFAPALSAYSHKSRREHSCLPNCLTDHASLARCPTLKCGKLRGRYLTHVLIEKSAARALGQAR
jgi:hypothetical protein